MNSYNNQCKRGPGQGDFLKPEHPMDRMNGQKMECPMEKEYCYKQEERKWPIGMTYVPMQKWKELYPVEEGFHWGTIFKELNLPFYGRREC